MLHFDEDRFHLAIPVSDAVAFALGRSDLGYAEPNEALRKIIGLLAIDALEYSEEWRPAAILRQSLERRWARFPL